HAVLGMGIAGIQVGALLLTLAAMNRGQGSGVRGQGSILAPDPGPQTPSSILTWLFIGSAGVLVTMHAVMTMEYNFTNQMHSARFYQIAAIVFPILLVSAARAARIRFPATAVAAVYTVLMLLMMWILPLFPAEPKLAPISHPV